MKVKEKINKIVESLIAILSIIIGGSLVFWAVYFIYAYHFTSVLWLMMFPMTILVSDLVLGSSLIVAAIYVFIDRIKGAKLFRLSSLLIILYGFNASVVALLQDTWFSYKFWDALVYLLVGVALYLFFNQKRYSKENVGDGKVVVLSILIYFLIDIFFYNWVYY